MKQKIQSLYVAVLFLSSTATLFGVNWSGTITSANDVYNQDISITSSPLEVDGIVTVSINDAGHTLSINQNTTIKADPVNGGMLHFIVASSLYIDLSTYDLTFSGSGAQPLELLISGSGTVVFGLGDGRIVRFTAPDASSAGTQVYIDMRQGGIQLQFLRFGAANPDANVTVAIGTHSILTYVSDAAVGDLAKEGTVRFYPNNIFGSPGTGRMILSIADKAGFVIASQVIDASNLVDFATPAGGHPICDVFGGNPPPLQSPSLYVLNSNATLGQYLYNPWGIEPNPFTGVRYGFVLGNDAELLIGSSTYLDYVGLANNVCPNPAIILPAGVTVQNVVKQRNPSAFIIDGLRDDNAGPALITMLGCTGLYFRSGVNASGTIEYPLGAAFEFTVTSIQTEGAGEFVFDVEGPLTVQGSNIYAGCPEQSRIELLSLMVTPTGQVLFPGPVDTACLPYAYTDTIFPCRTYDALARIYRAYNKGAFFINNFFTLNNVTLAHTDVNHAVYEKDDVRSEPTYVGGDIINFYDDARPYFVFSTSDSWPAAGSALYVYENIALTGVDFSIPANQSLFKFFYNGYCLDNGTGRQMILGTVIGSYACDGSTSIDQDAHLNVIQTSSLVPDAQLDLVVAPNSSAYNPLITSPVNPSQTSIHTLYLGHASNLSIGSVNPLFNAVTWPTATFFIGGEFFSFETRGGTINSPESSNISGQGGIFVDGNGIITIQKNPRLRTNVGAMITKSHNGVIDLPRNQVFYDLRVGVADWNLDLALTQTLIPYGMCVSDYSINWLEIKKDCTGFVSYPVMVMDACNTQSVVDANITNIPTISGLVDQFQVLGSRLGSPAHVKFDGGRARELVFFNTNHSAEAPVAVVVLQNNGRVGLGSASRNIDSLPVATLLGANGITIVANGSGTVDVNSDLIINNMCHILKGPNFKPTDTLQFFSETGKQIILKSCGTLDLSTFNTGGSIVFAGNVQLVCEAGSQINFGQSDAKMAFKDNAQLRDFSNDTQTYGCSECATEGMPGAITATDGRRIKISGLGSLEFHDNSLFEIDDEAIFGIESSSSSYCSPTTDITIRVQGNAQFLVAPKDGGSLQIGNTFAVAGGDVKYTLSIDDRGMVQIGPRGFMGHALGIVSKDADQPENSWLVDNLYNVSTITFDCVSGAFRHAIIYPGSSRYAGLFGLGNATYVLNVQQPASEPGPTYDLYSALGFRLNGGGNMYLKTTGTGVPVNPIVENIDVFQQTGLMKSYAMLKFPLAASYSPEDFLETLKVQSVCNKALGAISGGLSLGFDGGTVGAEGEVSNKMRVGYSYSGKLYRRWISQIVSGGAFTGITTRFAHEQQVGAAFISVAPAGDLLFVTEYRAN